MKSQVIQVILTEEKKGAGTEEDPIRIVKQLWTLDGKLIVEIDSQLNKTGGV